MVIYYAFQVDKYNTILFFLHALQMMIMSLKSHAIVVFIVASNTGNDIYICYVLKIIR